MIEPQYTSAGRAPKAFRLQIGRKLLALLLMFVLGFAAFQWFLHSEKSPFYQGQRQYWVAKQAGGLAQGSLVRVNGLEVGRVLSVERRPGHVLIYTQVDGDICLDPKLVWAQSFPEGLIGVPALQIWLKEKPQGNCAVAGDTLAFESSPGPLRFMPAMTALIDSIGIQWSFLNQQMDSLRILVPQYDTLMIGFSELNSDLQRMKGQMRTTGQLVQRNVKTVTETQQLVLESQNKIKSLPWDTMGIRLEQLIKRMDDVIQRLQKGSYAGLDQGHSILKNGELAVFKSSLESLSNHIKTGKLEMNVDVLD